MQLEISSRDAAQILAALRNWQDQMDREDLEGYYEGYFEQHDPMDRGELDGLCARIVQASLEAQKRDR